MSQVFLSYSREDVEAARALAERLERAGYGVWWDYKLLPGTNFSRAIEQAINAADCVMVLWSALSVDSDWVHAEAAEGLRRHRLIPVLLEEVQVPLEFRQTQAALLLGPPAGWQPEELDKIVAALARFGGAEGKRPPASPIPSPVSPETRLWPSRPGLAFRLTAFLTAILLGTSAISAFYWISEISAPPELWFVWFASFYLGAAVGLAGFLHRNGKLALAGWTCPYILFSTFSPAGSIQALPTAFEVFVPVVLALALGAVVLLIWALLSSRRLSKSSPRTLPAPRVVFWYYSSLLIVCGLSAVVYLRQNVAPTNSLLSLHGLRLACVGFIVSATLFSFLTHRSGSRRLRASALLSLILIPLAAIGGVLSVKVVDSQKGSLPGVTTTAVPLHSQEITNAVGAATFPGIPVGLYSVRAELEGFAPRQIVIFTLPLLGVPSEIQLEPAAKEMSLVWLSGVPERIPAPGATLLAALLAMISGVLFWKDRRRVWDPEPPNLPDPVAQTPLHIES
jgi:hypothetical protein